MNGFGTLALRIPVFGWLLADAIKGWPDAKYYFFANLALVLAAAIYEYGYPVVIVLAVTAAGLALVTLVYMTAADSFSRANRRVLAEAKRKQRAPI